MTLTNIGIATDLRPRADDTILARHVALLGSLSTRFIGSAVPRLPVTAPANVFRTKVHFVIELEVPGIDKTKDVFAELTGGFIKFTIDKPDPARKGTASLIERRFGRLERTFPAPKTADFAKGQLSYVDGVVSLHIPLKGSSTAGKFPMT